MTEKRYNLDIFTYVYINKLFYTMTTIIERLEAVRRHYDLSGRKLADRLGQRPSTVINYLNGTQAPKLEFIENILDLFPEVSAEWLIRGQGAMLIVDQPDVAELKKHYETELLVKEGIIKELRSIILEKNQDKQSLDRQQLVG